MGDKDIISKQIFKRLVQDFATYLFGLAVAEVELVESSHERIEDRHADLVAKVWQPDGAEFILHIEIQNDNQRLFPVRMLRYFSDLLLEHVGHEVRQYMVYIGREPLRMADGLKLPSLDYLYTIIDMQQVDCETLLQQDSADAWVLAVLCDFHGRKPRAVIHEILTRFLRVFQDQPSMLREYVSMLEILSDNRDLNLDIREELDMLTINLERLPSYQIGMEKGVVKGKAEGKIEGKAEGAKEQALAIATRLLSEGKELSWIASITGLSKDEIDRLKK
jgi:hypothetical protein